MEGNEDNREESCERVVDPVLGHDRGNSRSNSDATIDVSWIKQEPMDHDEDPHQQEPPPVQTSGRRSRRKRKFDWNQLDGNFRFRITRIKKEPVDHVDVTSRNEENISDAEMAGSGVPAVGNVEDSHQLNQSANATYDETHEDNSKSQECASCKQTFVVSPSRTLLPKRMQELCNECKLSANFCCKHCSRSFARVKEFKSHVRTCRAQFFSCHACNETFKTAEELENHKLSEHSTDPRSWFVCPICYEAFRKEKDRDNHKGLHKFKNPVICHHCKIAFGNLDLFSQHRATLDIEQLFICTVCNKGFKSKRLFDNDQQNHKIQSLNAGSKLMIPQPPCSVYFCPNCCSWFKSVSQISSHKCSTDSNFVSRPLEFTDAETPAQAVSMTNTVTVYRRTVTGTANEVQPLALASAGQTSQGDVESLTSDPGPQMHGEDTSYIPSGLEDVQTVVAETGDLPEQSTPPLTNTFLCHLCHQTFDSAEDLGYHPCLNLAGAGEISDPDEEEDGSSEDTDDGWIIDSDDGEPSSLATDKNFGHVSGYKDRKRKNGAFIEVASTGRLEGCFSCGRRVHHNFAPKCGRPWRYMCSACLMSISRHKEWSFKCSKCWQVFPSLDRLNRHLPWHRNKSVRRDYRRAGYISDNMHDLATTTPDSSVSSAQQQSPQELTHSQISGLAISESDVSEPFDTKDSANQGQSPLIHPSSTPTEQHPVVTSEQQQMGTEESNDSSVVYQSLDSVSGTSSEQYCSDEQESFVTQSSGKIPTPQQQTDSSSGGTMSTGSNPNQKHAPVTMKTEKHVAAIPATPEVTHGQAGVGKQPDQQPVKLPAVSAGGNNQKFVRMALPTTQGVTTPTATKTALVQLLSSKESTQPDHSNVLVIDPTKPIILQSGKVTMNSKPVYIAPASNPVVRRHILPKSAQTLGNLVPVLSTTSSQKATPDVSSSVSASSSNVQVGSTQGRILLNLSLKPSPGGKAPVLTATLNPNPQVKPEGTVSSKLPVSPPAENTATPTNPATSNEHQKQTTGSDKPPPVNTHTNFQIVQGISFLCHMCNKICRSTQELKTHGCNLHSFRCHMCSKVFDSPDLLYQHKCGGTSFYCRSCSKLCKSPEELNQHQCIKSNELKTRDAADRQTSSSSSVLGGSDHPPEKRKRGSSRNYQQISVPCSSCGQHFVPRVHSDKVKERNCKSCKEKMVLEANKNKLRCDECHLACSSPNALYNHKLRHVMLEKFSNS